MFRVFYFIMFCNVHPNYATACSKLWKHENLIMISVKPSSVNKKIVMCSYMNSKTFNTAQVSVITRLWMFISNHFFVFIASTTYSHDSLDDRRDERVRWLGKMADSEGRDWKWWKFGKALRGKVYDAFVRKY